MEREGSDGAAEYADFFAADSHKNRDSVCANAPKKLGLDIFIHKYDNENRLRKGVVEFMDYSQRGEQAG